MSASELRLLDFVEGAKKISKDFQLGSNQQGNTKRDQAPSIDVRLGISVIFRVLKDVFEHKVNRWYRAASRDYSPDIPIRFVPERSPSDKILLKRIQSAEQVCDILLIRPKNC